MTQEEKNLVLIDLCGRLPYDIKIKDEYGDYINVNIYNANIEHLIDRVVSGLDKMVLRPLSSMTAVEVDEYMSLKENIIACDDITYFFETHKSIDWLNKNMFDYRDLIRNRLASVAPEGMYENESDSVAENTTQM